MDEHVVQLRVRDWPNKVWRQEARGHRKATDLAIFSRNRRLPCSSLGESLAFISIGWPNASSMTRDRSAAQNKLAFCTLVRIAIPRFVSGGNDKSPEKPAVPPP